MAGRSILKLSELASIITGSTPSASSPEAWGDACDFITPSDQRNDRREAIPERRLSADGVRLLANRVVPARSTNLTCIGSTIGKVSMAMREAVTNQQINSLVARDGVSDPDFLYYLIKGWSPELKQAASGSATPIVNKKVLSDCRFEIPDVGQQQAIGEVLGALDDKIAADTKSADALANLGAGLYAGALQHVDLESVRLDCIARHLPGKYLPKEAYAAGGIYRVYGSNSDMGSHDEALYPGGFAVLARIGSNCGSLRWSQRAAWVNNNASALVPEGGFDPWVLRHALERVDMEPHRGGSGQPFIRIDSLMSSFVSVPPPEKRRAIAPVLQNLAELETLFRESSATLAAMRDALLPSLMSGRIRVKDAEQMVGDVA